MSYRYKVKIEAHGANGGQGFSGNNGSRSLGGFGAKIDVEYEVLPASVENPYPGFSTDGSGNIVWQLKYRLIEGGDGGKTHTYYGGDGGDGVEVLLRGGFIIAIAGGGGGGGGNDGTEVLRAGGPAGNRVARDEYSYWRVVGGGGGRAYPDNFGGGGAGVGGSGAYTNLDGYNNTWFYGGSNGVGHTSAPPTGGQGGNGGAGSSYTNWAGGGGGGGGWGGGGGGGSAIGRASGGGGGGSIVWNNENDALIGFKCVDNTSIFQTGTTNIQTNTSTNASLKFTSYKSPDNGTTWITQKTEAISTIPTTSTDVDIILHNAPDFNTITPASVDILSDQSYTWDLTLQSGTYEGDEQYSIFQSPAGTYSAFTNSSTNPSVPITYSGVTRGTVTYNISTRKLTFTGSGLEHDNVTSSFQVYVKDAVTSSGYGNGSTSVSVTQHKRLYKHESSKSFTASPPIANTGLITSSGVDISNLFQPKSFLDFPPTATNIGKFFNSSSTPTVDFSDIFGEYKSDYSGNDIISIDTGFQIGGTDIRHIYAAKKTSLDIFDTSPGRKNYRFSLTENTTVLIICVGGGGAGTYQYGGHGGKIILHETTLIPGDYDLSFNVGAGETNLGSGSVVTRRGGDSSITGTSNGGTIINYDTSVGGLTPRVNNNDGGLLGYDAQDGGFRLKYGVNTYDIGGGGGGGQYKVAGINMAGGNGYYGGANGDTFDNYRKPRNSNYGGGGAGGYYGYRTPQSQYPSYSNGSNGGHGLCAILFKPNPP